MSMIPGAWAFISSKRESGDFYSVMYTEENSADVMHTSYFSRTHGRCPWRKKAVMWRNFKFLNMKHVEKAKISPQVD